MTSTNGDAPSVAFSHDLLSALDAANASGLDLSRVGELEVPYDCPQCDAHVIVPVEYADGKLHLRRGQVTVATVQHDDWCPVPEQMNGHA